MSRLSLPVHARGQWSGVREALPRDVARARASSVSWVLFLLVNVAMFVRPSEIFPALDGVPIYESLILACGLFSCLAVMEHLSWRSLAERPITICVIGVLVAIALSHLSHLRLGQARTGTMIFLKVVIYYLLLVVNLCTVARLRQFLFWLVLMIGALTALALLQYHEVINIDALKVLELKDEEDAVFMRRLQSTGIFNDPNDLSLILVAGMILCLYWFGERRTGPLRVCWLVPFVVLGYALTLTGSRGGLLGLLAGLVVLFRSRYSWVKTAALAAVMVPALLLVAGGRQANIDLASREDTAQERFQLWSEGLILLRQSPLFGIGYDQYQEQVLMVAHNSYVHCYTELGFFGGTLFVGAFYCGWLALRRGNEAGRTVGDPDVQRLRPYLLAMLCAYAVGLFSLSRSYILTTYLVLGLTAVYMALASRDGALSMPRFDSRLLGRLGAVSALCLVGIYVFVRVVTNWG